MATAPSVAGATKPSSVSIASRKVSRPRIERSTSAHVGSSVPRDVVPWRQSGSPVSASMQTRVRLVLISRRSPARTGKTRREAGDCQKGSRGRETSTDQPSGCCPNGRPAGSSPPRRERPEVIGASLDPAAISRRLARPVQGASPERAAIQPCSDSPDPEPTSAAEPSAAAPVSSSRPSPSASEPTRVRSRADARDGSNAVAARSQDARASATSPRSSSRSPTAIQARPAAGVTGHRRATARRGAQSPPRPASRASSRARSLASR